MFAIYRDASTERPYVLRRFDLNRGCPIGIEVYRGSDIGEVRNFLAERCTTRLENHDRQSRHPQSLLELWVKPKPR